MNNNTLKKKQRLLRNELRKYGILPSYGEPLTVEQEKIWERTNHLDKTVLLIKDEIDKEKCSICGDPVYDKFKLLCKTHYLIEHKGRKERRCIVCNETDPDKFYEKYKSKCKIHYIESSINRQKKRKDKLYGGNIDEFKKLMIKERVLGAKHRALKKNIEFELTEEIIWSKIDEQKNKCYLSGLEMTLDIKSWESLTLDRIDPLIGYTVDNVILTTRFMNVSRNNMTLDEFNIRLQMYYGVGLEFLKKFRF